MRRAILRFSCLLAGASILLTSALIWIFAYQSFSARVRRELRADADYIAGAVETRGADFLREMRTGPSGSRVTHIAETGEVLYDTRQDAGVMENHLDRPEVREALADGAGETTRFSRTLSERTYYRAVRLSDGSVLRVASTSDSVFAAISGLAAVTACIALAVFAAAAVVSARVTRALVAPINGIDPETPGDDAVYAELTPLLTRLREQRGRLESQIEDREKMRREFSANVSHELKTPITAISGYAEILANGVARAGDTRNFAGKIYDEAQRLIALVDDIMLVSRLDEGAAGFLPESVELLSLARAVAERFRPAAAERGITMAVRGGEFTIMGYRHVLDETVSNLIDNAVKYNRDGGSVNVTVSGDGGGVALTVTDTGVGIPAEDRERVFERFYRADASRALAPGTGLGLAIVKHAAQLHGARTELHSDGGAGTCVKVIFPR
ncbi:MAG: two-component sensor histidine kinase [Oscillospiraceae bacterium]|jgi:two-component system phosphate regulon sensor histidine kinase PhoR|nr:two-component sensor histidine kinase [Oscillospiraceae bacterium]